MSWRSAHSPNRPCRQNRQTPQGRPAAGITRSPSDHPATPGPSFAIVPDASWPWVTTSGTNGPPEDAVDQAQVGVADPAVLHLDEHLARAGLRNRPVLDRPLAGRLV